MIATAALDSYQRWMYMINGLSFLKVVRFTSGSTQAFATPATSMGPAQPSRHLYVFSKEGI